MIGRETRVLLRHHVKGIIEARLAAYPELSAVRLYREEVRSAGYEGGYDQVKRYVREVRPRDPAEPVRRFETPPGHQGQVDFADFRLPSPSDRRLNRAVPAILSGRQ